MRLALSCAALAAATVANAQVRPDAGSTQRDLEQRPLEAPRRGPALPSEPARPAMKADDTQRFAVTQVRVTGSKAFPAETLVALVRDDLVGKSVTLRQLQDAAAKITAYYRARGYLVARAYVPQQAIAASGAQIEIAVLEGSLGALQINNKSRLSDSAVRRFTAPLAPGAPLAVDAFERPILLLSDQAGVGGVEPVLRAGETAGTSELALGLGEAPLAGGQADFDNHGNRFTGRYRVGASLGLNSPFGLGESLNARVLRSTSGGLGAVSLRAVLPLGGDGWKAGASYSDTRYSLGDDFAALRASGSARATGAFASYPLVRSQRWNLNATGAWDAKRFEDRVASTGAVTPKKVDGGSATLGGDLRDPLWENSVLAWSATVLSGRLSIDEAGARAADAAGAGAQGGFRKTSLSLLYLQALGGNWSAYASVQGQRASRNLDSSEKLSLGGPQAVRAYPSGEAAGDEGELATVELRYALREAWGGVSPTLVLFYDHGRTRANKNPFAPGSNERTLGGAGVGVTASSRNVSVRTYWAAKTQGGAATADHDRGSRLWLQAAIAF